MLTNGKTGMWMSATVRLYSLYQSCGIYVFTVILKTSHSTLQYCTIKCCRSERGGWLGLTRHSPTPLEKCDEVQNLWPIVLRGCCVNIYINRPVPTVRTVKILNMIQEEPEVKMRIIGIIKNKIMEALTPAILKLKVSWFS